MSTYLVGDSVGDAISYEHSYVPPRYKQNNQQVHAGSG